MKETNKRLKAVVAGGAGYIGSVVTKTLVEAGHTVTVLDDLSKGHRDAIHPDAAFVEGDISDPLAVQSACKNGVDVAMHFAAFIEVGESVLDPAKYYENNVLKAVQYCNNLRKSGVDKLVFSSTAAVYGNPETVPLTETAALKPVNPYGRTKLMIEEVLRDYDTAYAFRSVCLRYFNAGGAYGNCGEAHDPESHLIPLIFNAVLAGKRLKVFGTDYDTHDGSCVRDYIHVKDLAQAHLMAAEYLAAGNESNAFNLGSGDGFTVIEVINAVARVIGRKVLYDIVDRRPGDPASLVASHAKIKAALGWGDKLSSLDEIIKTAWKWKQEHPNAYGDK